jgi:hypothetical protein
MNPLHLSLLYQFVFCSVDIFWPPLWFSCRYIRQLVDSGSIDKQVFQNEDPVVDSARFQSFEGYLRQAYKNENMAFGKLDRRDPFDDRQSKRLDDHQ